MKSLRRNGDLGPLKRCSFVSPAWGEWLPYPFHLKSTLCRKEYSLYIVLVSYGGVTLRKPYRQITLKNTAMLYHVASLALHPAMFSRRQRSSCGRIENGEHGEGFCFLIANYGTRIVFFFSHESWKAMKTPGAHDNRTYAFSTSCITDL